MKKLAPSSDEITSTPNKGSNKRVSKRKRASYDEKVKAEVIRKIVDGSMTVRQAAESIGTSYANAYRWTRPAAGASSSVKLQTKKGRGRPALHQKTTTSNAPQAKAPTATGVAAERTVTLPWHEAKILVPIIREAFYATTYPELRGQLALIAMRFSP